MKGREGRGPEPTLQNCDRYGRIFVNVPQSIRECLIVWEDPYGKYAPRVETDRILPSALRALRE